MLIICEFERLIATFRRVFVYILFCIGKEFGRGQYGVLFLKCTCWRGDIV